MSKAILVTDMPNSCNECPIRNSIGYGKWCTGFDDTFIDSYPTKPNWCLLKPLPEKEDVNLFNDRAGYALGWNACIDEILGE